MAQIAGRRTLAALRRGAWACVAGAGSWRLNLKISRVGGRVRYPDSYAGAQSLRMNLRVYLIRASCEGRVVDIATVDTARMAISKFLDARERYERVWVCDDSDNLLTFDELAARAQEEEGRTQRS
jgi:hypothetical protein